MFTTRALSLSILKVGTASCWSTCLPPGPCLSPFSRKVQQAAGPPVYHHGSVSLHSQGRYSKLLVHLFTTRALSLSILKEGTASCWSTCLPPRLCLSPFSR
ncbi:hypothetical protein DPMN_194575 [Dreissena polymorpha]|uniref:Secreted protein n=1 Tax=Dreissena polymorpha TaxID=45954 RepID=A0A9D3Y6L9_DREPO|nr:hypothetical protein DPMN_194575 [Dreissena polymorpha]